MLNIVKKLCKPIIISLCFSSIFILIFYFTCNHYLKYYSRVFDTITINLNNNKKIDITYNEKENKLSNYPSYGDNFATLNIDSANIHLPVVHGDSLKILRHNVGHYAGSYFPGEGGTIILAGHVTSDFLRNLYNVKKNDVINLNTLYGDYNYIVYDIKVIKETEVEEFNISKNEEILIVYTCYPKVSIGRKTNRYLVYAKLLGDNNE